MKEEQKTGEPFVLFAEWERLVEEILMRTAKFPRRFRFTLANRIDMLVLEVVELLVKARYSSI